MKVKRFSVSDPVASDSVRGCLYWYRPKTASTGAVEQESETHKNEIDSSQDVIQVLRTAHQHQVHLNVLADQKANINIGFTLFFITLTHTQLSLGASGDTLVRAIFILLILSIATSLLLALLVVLPRTGKARIRDAGQMSNPFYFGMFTQLSQQEFTDYLAVQLGENFRSRELITIDIYQIGQVLRRKYRFLRLSYGFLGLSAVIAVALYCYKILMT